MKKYGIHPKTTSETAAECRRLAPWIPDLGSGDLEPEQAAAVRTHLEGCAHCRGEAEAMLRVRSLLQAERCPEVRLPSGAALAGRILEREAARSREPWVRWSWPWVRSGPGWATVAVASFAVALLVRPGLEPQISAPGPAPVAEPLPALVVIDDERTGRRVLLAPADAGGQDG